MSWGACFMFFLAGFNAALALVSLWGGAANPLTIALAILTFCIGIYVDRAAE